MSNVNADAAAAAAVAAVAACNPAAAERLYAWQWPDGTDPVLATKLNAILVQQLGISNFFMAPHGQKARMEREYADVLIGSGELSRPGYRSPAQSGIIAKITKLVESRISQLKKGTATGQHDAEVDDNLDLFCRAIIEHRQEHVERAKLHSGKRKLTNRKENNTVSKLSKLSKETSMLLMLMEMNEVALRSTTPPLNDKKRKSPTKVDRKPPSI